MSTTRAANLYFVVIDNCDVDFFAYFFGRRALFDPGITATRVNLSHTAP